MKSIKTKLIVVFTTMILSVVLINGLIFIRISQGTIKSEAEGSLQILASEGAKLVENRMKSILSTLNLIAKNKTIQDMGWEVDISILKEELEKTDFVDVGYVMPNGYTHYADGTVRLMIDREYISGALEGKEEISDVVISRVTRKPEIEAAVPIMKGSIIVGALVGRMEASALSEITRDIGFGEKGYSYMINEYGTMIAHPNEEYIIKKFNPTKEAEENSQLADMSEAFHIIMKEKMGTTSYTYEEGNLYAGYAPIGGTKWSFVITADEDEIMAAIPKMVRIILTVIVVVCIVSLAVIIPLDNALIKPLIELTRHSKRISNLDIQENISQIYINRKDEIGTLSSAFQNLTDSLRNIMKNLTFAAEQVFDTASELSVTSQQSVVTIKTITTSMEDISRGAIEQSENTAAGMEQATILENKLKKNHELMGHLNSSIGQVTWLVENGLIDIEKLNTMTNENDLAMNNICNIISQVKQSAKKIGDASKLISDMSRQINLLSLNASIESARAGEAGRGFAVLAEEITNLADQSAQSTTYIDATILELQAKIEYAVDGANRVSVTSKKQQESVEDTVKKYHDISHAMISSKTAVEELNKSEEDMKAAKEEIKDMLKTLSAIAEENVATTQETTATMQEQTAAYHVVSEVSNKLTELATQHRATIKRFKI
ncbi:MAG: methyl-accepting chemotaxis protein [Herbinix sp.]|nr:methyl-accepting chemotaxis protein [Herbinix sp.]